ncbi:hypothetical protein C8R45DRAFT_1074844 [Mycena sanguinolenta]|nr:hypothetical protein C8R45DRAFT_1074844 [Mycena sanguinolenta]
MCEFGDRHVGWTTELPNADSEIHAVSLNRERNGKRKGLCGQVWEFCLDSSRITRSAVNSTVDHDSQAGLNVSDLFSPKTEGSQRLAEIAPLANDTSCLGLRLDPRRMRRTIAIQKFEQTSVVQTVKSKLGCRLQDWWSCRATITGLKSDGPRAPQGRQWGERIDEYESRQTNLVWRQQAAKDKRPALACSNSQLWGLENFTPQWTRTEGRNRMKSDGGSAGKSIAPAVKPSPRSYCVRKEAKKIQLKARHQVRDLICHFKLKIVDLRTTQSINRENFRQSMTSRHSTTMNLETIRNSAIPSDRGLFDWAWFSLATPSREDSPNRSRMVLISKVAMQPPIPRESKLPL